MSVVDIKGQSYGRLVVLKRHPKNTAAGKARWVCRCSCGQTLTVIGGDLRSGRTQSCGCYQVEQTSQSNYRHGGRVGSDFTPEYRTYHHMLSRCNSDDPDYGGRGISVCKRWQGEGGFERFLADMGPRPDGTTLERKNVNGNYTPSNCIWATTVAQANNKRSNHYVTHKGRTLTVAQWSRELGINYQTLQSRLHNGWAIADALS